MSNENQTTSSVVHRSLDFKVLAVSNAIFPFSSLISALIEVFNTCLIKPDHNLVESKLLNWQPNCVFVDLDYVSETFTNQLISDAGRFGVKVFVHDTENGTYALNKTNSAAEVECISKYMAASDVIKQLDAMAARSRGNPHHNNGTKAQMLQEIYHQIACELHDELGSLLSSMRLKLDSMYGVVEDHGLAKDLLLRQLNDLDKIVFEAISSVKKISAQHRQPHVELDLLAQFDMLIRTLDIAVYKQVTSHAIKQIDKMDKAILFQVYRIIQEALNNVQYHSKANEASVKFDSNHSALLIDIIDQGIGFNVDQVTEKLSSFGLSGMYERASRINANLSVNSAPSEGTYIKIEVPAVS